MKLCTLASGSTGNCALISHMGANILLDAGISLKRIKAGLAQCGLEPRDITAVVVTHEHSDHVKALPMITKYLSCPIYASHGTAGKLYSLLPQTAGHVTEFSAGDSFDLEGITVKTFHTPHDTPESTGYRFESGGRVLFFATDTGHITDEMYRAARGANTAVIEANHDLAMLRYGPYPQFLKNRILSGTGHLSNNDCGEFAAALLNGGTERLILAHLSQENNTPGTAKKAVLDALYAQGAKDEDFRLSVAPAIEPGEVFSI